MLDSLKYSSNNKNVFILNHINNKIKERYRRDESQIRYRGGEFANLKSQTRLFVVLTFLNSVLISNKQIFAISVPDSECLNKNKTEKNNYSLSLLLRRLLSIPIIFLISLSLFIRYSSFTFFHNKQCHALIFSLFLQYLPDFLIESCTWRYTL